MEENYYQDGLLNGIIKKYNQDNGELEYKMFYEKGTLMNTVEIN